MKKIISLSIISVILFSTLNFVYASQGWLDKLLDINYWIEKLKLDSVQLKIIHLDSKKNREILRKLKQYDEILRTEIIENYELGNYNYYRANDIIRNYTNFIYYTNKYFFYLRWKEIAPNYLEVDRAIENSYVQMRRYYSRLKVKMLKK